MSRAKGLRYIVTGPPWFKGEPSYDDPGPAISRTITAASNVPKGIAATFYARDAITDNIIGYSECDEHGHITTRRNA